MIQLTLQTLRKKSFQCLQCFGSHLWSSILCLALLCTTLVVYRYPRWLVDVWLNRPSPLLTLLLGPLIIPTIAIESLSPPDNDDDDDDDNAGLHEILILLGHLAGREAAAAA